MSDHRQTLAAAAELRLHQLAQRSEFYVAACRLVGWGGLAGLAFYAQLTPGDLIPVQSRFWSDVNVVGVLVYAAGSLAVFLALRRGWFPPWLPVTLVLVDGVMYALGLWCWHEAYGTAMFLRADNMTVVVLVCVFMAVAGVMRLQWITSVLGSAVAFGLYAIAAQWNPPNFVAAVGLSAVFGMLAIMGRWLTATVTTAVQGELARTALSRFLPANVVDDAHVDLQRLVEPRLRQASVLVADVRGFSSWSERRSPSEVLEFVSRVQGAMASCVVEHGGHVDKFLGDGMLAAFGVLDDGENHAERAVACAVDIRRAVAELRGPGVTADQPVRVGIGVHTGAVVAGCIGTGERLEFTILGDTVNTAARLESHTKKLGVAVLVSEVTARAAGPLPLRSLGEASLRGKQQVLEVYTVDAELAA